eukprot:GFUD01134046.1.p1 GENE.GFUD01134046.1~~GFUD01134046.1.p1  ORF type:complete len:334 (+),score=81.81 GFUD01134046.1:35-1036(+)
MGQNCCKFETPFENLEEEEEDEGAPTPLPPMIQVVEYDVGIVGEVMAILAHLLSNGVNLMKKDGVELYFTLCDTLGDTLKTLGHNQETRLTCRHTSSATELCVVTTLGLKDPLVDSLAEYTRGKTLEGFKCSTCPGNLEQDCFRQICFDKLSPMLQFRLNRGGYDFEKDQRMKLLNHCVFPDELDMEPYTLGYINKQQANRSETQQEARNMRYQLLGIVAASGETYDTNFHYYSYLKTGDQWLKFEDGNVSEVDMADPEQQGRWRDAYLLFYCRTDLISVLGTADVPRDTSTESEDLLPSPFDSAAHQILNLLFEDKAEYGKAKDIFDQFKCI